MSPTPPASPNLCRKSSRASSKQTNPLKTVALKNAASAHVSGQASRTLIPVTANLQSTRSQGSSMSLLSQNVGDLMMNDNNETQSEPIVLESSANEESSMSEDEYNENENDYADITSDEEASPKTKTEKNSNLNKTFLF